MLCETDGIGDRGIGCGRGSAHPVRDRGRPKFVRSPITGDGMPSTASTRSVVDAESDFPEYVAGLEDQIRKAMDG